MITEPVPARPAADPLEEIVVLARSGRCGLTLPGSLERTRIANSARKPRLLDWEHST